MVRSTNAELPLPRLHIGQLRIIWTNMHSLHIGDSLDTAKCVAINLLHDVGIYVRLIPLPSHANFDYDTFARCVTPSDSARIFRSRIPSYSSHNRNRYLDEAANWIKQNVSSINALIFDPDTGVRPDRDTNKFFGLQRIRKFIKQFPQIAIGVYQHRGTGGLTYSESLELIPNLHCCGYDFGAAALLFWARDDGANKIDLIRKTFESRLNPSRLVLRSI
jgi:hypothetical protein